MNILLRRHITLLSIITILISSCTKTNTSKTPTGNSENKKKTEITTSKGPYNASRTLKFDLIHTKLAVSLDWKKQYLNGVATLILKPYFYPQNSLDLDAKGMDIHSITLSGKEEKTLKYSYDKTILKITLDKTYTKTDSFSIQINYTAKPNELPKTGNSAIMENKGLYFINPDGSDKDKPRQFWTQGETESASCWFPTIDSPNERCTQEMLITVDTNLVVLSNGEFIYSKNNGNGTKTDHWKQDLPHAPYLFMMAGGEFSVVKDHWHDMEVNYYIEPAYEKYAKNIFGNTPKMIEFYSNTLGYKYPWSKYSQIVVRDFVSGAMENTSASVFMEALQCDDRQLLDENWDGIIAHELFHHWFGDLVTCESWSNLPLNESFANYSEYLWSEHKDGIDEADYLDEKEEEEYFSEAVTKQEPLIRYRYVDKEDMFDRHSYNKGGRVLHMLRKYVGDEAFFESLKLYLKKNQFTSVEIHTLRLAFEEVTGEDLNWFFNQWFLSPGHPELKVSHNYAAGILKVNIKQIQDTTLSPIYRLPLAMDVWENGSKTRYNIVVDKSQQEFSFPVFTEPQNVLVDANLQMLGKIYHEKSDKELIHQYENSDRYKARMVAIEKLFAPKEGISNYNPFADTAKVKILYKAFDDKFWVIREFALEQLSKYLVPNLSEVMKKIEVMAQHDSKPSVRSRAIYLISSFDNQKYSYVYELGLREKPYSIASASLSSYLKTDATDKDKKTESFEDMNNSDIIITLADYYIYTKNINKYDWFKKKIISKSGRELYYMIGFFGEYVKLLQGAEREDGKKVIEEISINNRYEKIRQMAGKYLKEIN